MRGRVFGAGLALLLGACVSHPVGPARTFGKYEGKATTSAKSVLSAVETGRMVAGAATRHHLPGPYVGLTLSDAEDAVAGVSGTFASIQPPNDRADQLRTELGDLFSSAEDHLADLRIAARRGQISELAKMAAPLDDDAQKLQAFVQAHQ